MPNRVTSCHVISRHVKSRHVTSCHIMSRHVTSWHVMSGHVTPCHVMSRHVSHVMSRHGKQNLPVGHSLLPRSRNTSLFAFLQTSLIRGGSDGGGIVLLLPSSLLPVYQRIRKSFHGYSCLYHTVFGYISVLIDVVQFRVREPVILTFLVVFLTV